MVSKKELNTKFSSVTTPCWPLYNYQFSLQFTASTFRVQAVKLFKLQAIHTKYRKILTSPTALYQSALQPSHSLPYISVPDTRKAFTFCCSFNCKRNTKGSFVLGIITWALDTGDLLGSRLDRFIPSEGQYVPTNTLCETQSKSGRFGRKRINSSLPQFEIWDRPSHSLVLRKTARFSSSYLQFRRLVTY